MIIPPYLIKGDIIGIVCPAGYMPLEKAEACIQTLKKWGFRVVIGKTLGHQYHYFSGTDEERLQDLQDMLDNPEIKAILCGRGGYGSSRIIDRINWKAFKKNPKWVIGFSDITVFHSFLFTRLKTASLHAPMAGAFNEEASVNPFIKSLKSAITGKPAIYKVTAHPANCRGEGKGLLVGGNLSLLAHQIGTDSDIDSKGKILFLEDVGEYIYNIDRMLLQLLRAGKLDRLAGLIMGGFSDLKDTTTPFGQTFEDLVLDKVSAFGYPVCFNFPVSHNKENYALKIGAAYVLSVGKTVVLREEGQF